MMAWSGALFMALCIELKIVVEIDRSSDTCNACLIMCFTSVGSLFMSSLLREASIGSIDLLPSLTISPLFESFIIGLSTELLFSMGMCGVAYTFPPFLCANFDRYTLQYMSISSWGLGFGVWGLGFGVW